MDDVSRRRDIREEDGQRFLDLCIHKSGDQYRSFMHIQTRAQQLFSASAIIMGVLVSALINAKVNLEPVPAIILWVILGTFVLTPLMCLLTLGSSAWKAGPPLSNVEADYLKPLYERGDSVALWLVGQMDKSYWGNLSTQKRNGWYLNIAATSMVVQLVAIAAGAYYLSTVFLVPPPLP